MAKKNLTVTQVKMFETMINADFKELMDRVREYRTALGEQARVDVSKEKGLFELKMAEKKLELQLSEVREKIGRISGKNKWDKNKDFEAAVERRVSELLGSIGDGSLATIEATYEHFLRKVRLAGLTEEVREVFEKELPAKLAEISASVKALPAPATVSDSDRILLEE